MNVDKHQYKDFIATRLYCPSCRQSMPVRERLLLILPTGYLYEYVCSQCHQVLGDKKETLRKEDEHLF